MALLLVALILLGGMAWIRLAPSDPARWHLDPGNAIAFGALTAFPPGPESVIAVDGGARAMITLFDKSPEDALAALDAIALATPRTHRLAGRPDEGRITWVTRSLVFGFPDYTTAEARTAGPMVNVDIYARQRFGRKDFGVNATRLRSWIGKLSP